MAKRKTRKVRHLPGGVRQKTGEMLHIDDNAVTAYDLCNAEHMSKKDMENALEELADKGLLEYVNENGVVKYSLYAPKGAIW